MDKEEPKKETLPEKYKEKTPSRIQERRLKPFYSGSIWDTFRRLEYELNKEMESIEKGIREHGFGGIEAKIKEEGDKYVINLDLTGKDIQEKDIDLSYKNNTLFLSIEQEKKSKKGLMRRSFNFAEFLPGADFDQVEAVYKNQVLTLNLPKKSEYVTRQIPIKTETKEQ
ncbi:Hsp20/alpha crystallin family protein [Candidatus Woesearchaeota archaeon]|nr:Hsp20/alpha crystallin family protein [Candidatus Woesearchaeota archaeon]